MSTSSTTHTRSEFGLSTCTVFSYPSSGGIILKNCTGVELDHLDLPRTKKGFSREDPMKEDYPPDLNVGSPSMGGVWVLKMFSKKVFTGLEIDAPERPEDWARLWLSLDDGGEM